MKRMRKEDIPAYVEAKAATGCDITAIGDEYYIIGDADLPKPRCFDVQPELAEISEEFGECDHLRREIIAYLHLIGRSYVPDDAHVDGTNTFTTH